MMKYYSVTKRNRIEATMSMNFDNVPNSDRNISILNDIKGHL